MGLLLLLPFTPISYLSRCIRGDQAYNTLSVFGRTAKKLDNTINELKDQTLVGQVVSYPLLSSAWMICTTISYFHREKSDVVVGKIQEVTQELFTKLEEIKNDIILLSQNLESRYAVLENEVNALEKIQQEHLINLRKRCDVLKETQEKLQKDIQSVNEVASQGNWSKREEFFKQTREENERWLKKMAQLEEDIVRKSSDIDVRA